MSNYIKTTDFAIKDTYSSGDPRKIAKGADVDTEFNNIATAIATKEDASNSGIANGFCPLDASALVTKTFQWTTTAYTDAANAFTQPQSIAGSNATLFTLTDSGTTTLNQLLISATSATDGAAIKLLGNGATTPSKTLRVVNGAFQITNDAFSSVIFSLTDAGAVSATSFAGNGASLTSLNASNISSGSIASAQVPSTIVTQYASSMKCQNVTGKTGYKVTLQSGGSPSGGADGDIFYIY